MVDFITRYFNSFISSFRGNKSLKEDVRHSVKKYYNTYKLLEKYDEKSTKSPEVLADPEGLQDYFQSLH